MRLPGTIELTVHVVLTGHAYLWLDDPADASELEPGDLALVPGGPDHHLAHDPRVTCVPHERFLEPRAGGGGSLRVIRTRRCSCAARTVFAVT